MDSVDKTIRVNDTKAPIQSVKPISGSCYRPSEEMRTRIPLTVQRLGAPWNINQLVEQCVRMALPEFEKRGAIANGKVRR